MSKRPTFWKLLKLDKIYLSCDTENAHKTGNVAEQTVLSS